MAVQARATHPVWSLFDKYSEGWRRALRNAAARAAHGDTGSAFVLPHAGAVLIAVPLHQRRRCRGAVIAACLTPEFLDQEGRHRFCARFGLDHEVVAQASAGVTTHDLTTVRAYADILRQELQAVSSSTSCTREISDLSHHLAQAYEELNLIYRVSTNLSVLRKPLEHFQTLCHEIVGATPIESVAVVLEPSGTGGAPSVSTAGPLKAPADDLLRLYQQVRGAERNAGTCLMVNHVPATPACAWAAGWLERFLCFDLARAGRVYGCLLAMNHVRREEFGSQEVRLINAVVERSAAFLENVRLYEDLEQLFMGMMHALVSSIDAKDPYTCGHSQRVAWLSRRLARTAGMDETLCQRVYLSGLLHDVGKIGISESVLRKEGRLTEAEYEEMKRHPAIGARILESVPQMADVIPGVLHHHERMDGRGYPCGLKGDDIPELGRVIGLADSLDAMTTNRTYRSARSIDTAAAEIRRCAGTQFDRVLVDLLLAQDLRAMLHEMNASQSPGIDPRSVLSHPALHAAER